MKICAINYELSRCFLILVTKSNWSLCSCFNKQTIEIFQLINKQAAMLYISDIHIKVNSYSALKSFSFLRIKNFATLKESRVDFC